VRKKPFLLEFSPDPKGKLQPAEVILKIASPNFKPRSQSKKLKVPPKHDSEVCTFLLTPLLCGELVVNLELLVRDQVVASKSIRTRAELEGTQVSPARVIVTVPLLLAVLDGRLLGNLSEESIRAIPPLLAQQIQRKEQLRESQNRVTDDVEGAAAMNAELQRSGASGALLGKKPEGTEPFPQFSANDLRAISPSLSKPKIITTAAGLLALLLVVLGIAFVGPLRNSKKVAQTSAPETQSVPPANRDSEQVGNTDHEPVVALTPTAGDPDRRAIDTLIRELSLAFSHRSIAELQEIWPQMGDNAKALKGSFDSAQSFSPEFHIENIIIHPDTPTADVWGTYDGKSISEGKESTRSGKFTLKLFKRDGNWYIDEATF
jgi:hypothetical protein